VFGSGGLGDDGVQHCLLIGCRFRLAILQNCLRALSVCLEWCGQGGGGGRVWRASFSKFTALQDCYPGKRATDQTKVLFHLSTPLALLVLRRTFLNAWPHLQPFHS